MCKLFFWCGRPRGTHCAFEITLSWAITLTLLLVCAFSPRVHSIPRGPHNQALAFELPERSGHEHQQSGNAASFLAENEKKTITLSSFLLVRSMGLAPQPYGRRRFCAFFCAANAVAITPGTKNSALCCFLNVPFKSHTFLQKK